MNANPLALLAGLADAGVDFVVIGGIAVVAHGHIRATRDLDITYATEPPNLEALGRVLVDLDATHGALNLLATPPGAPASSELKQRAEMIDVDGRDVAIASLDDLVTMKRAAGRPRDLEDIEALEAIRRLRTEQPRT